MASVLIIDDDKHICKMLATWVDRLGHQADVAHTISDGLNMALEGEFDVIFLDVQMPDGSGLDILPKVREKPSPPEVIIITGQGNENGAELAIRNGAWDYIEKPLSPKNLTLPLKRILQYREELKQTKKPTTALRLDSIIGRSHQIRRCFDSLAEAATSEANVLITGESGTGKELFARAIHNNSKRASKSLVVVDCAALPDTLVESSLFGHEKGAFTSADKAQDGLIKQAHQGTLFLDEIGELTLSVQKSFLRVLEERKFRKVGGSHEEESDFRLVAATNRDLDAEVDKGAFRKDLIYRLRSVAIELPPLRTRTDDIRDLTLHYVPIFCEKYELEIKGFSPEFLEILQAHEWPGNIRELVNTIEQAVVKARYEAALYEKHLPVQLRVSLAKKSVSSNIQSASVENEPEISISPKPLSSFKEYRNSLLAEGGKKYFQELLTLTNGDINEACMIAGIKRTRLYALLKEYNISRLGWTLQNNS